MQAGKLIGCKARGQSVTIEPGGQVELSGAPVHNLHQTQAEVRQHLQQAGAAAAEIGVQFLGIGLDPRSRSGDLDFMPKKRYHLLREYLQDVSPDGFGRELFVNTTSTQVCASSPGGAVSCGVPQLANPAIHANHALHASGDTRQ